MEVGSAPLFRVLPWSLSLLSLTASSALSSALYHSITAKQRDLYVCVCVVCVCVCVCVCVYIYIYGTISSGVPYIYIYIYRHRQKDWYPSVKEKIGRAHV